MISKLKPRVLMKILMILSFVFMISISVLAAAHANPSDTYWDGENAGDTYWQDGNSGDTYWDGENSGDYYWDGENAGDYYWDGENAGDYYWDGENAGDYYWDGDEYYTEYPEDGGTGWQGDSDFNTYDDSFEPETQPPFQNPEDDVLEEPDEDEEDEPGFDPEPDDGDDEPLPNQPARWFPLYNQRILQGSAYNTVVYPSLATKCIDPDDPFVMTVISKFFDFNLAFSGLDLVIRNLNPDYTGTSKIDLDCNGVQNSFYLTVVPSGEGDDGEDERPSYGVHISNIRIMSDNQDIQPGEEIAIKTEISNNGNKKLKGVKFTAVIQDLGVKRSEGPFDLRSGNEVSKTVFLNIPEYVTPGWYYIRLTLSDSNGEVKRIVHREVFIGEQ